MTVTMRAALYLRVSTARQAEHDVSIPDQRRQCEAYCASRGYELVETYVEPGASATNDRRPEFQRMIEAGTSRPPRFDIVVVHSFSRFFRDHFELEFYIRKLARNGVRLVSITQEMGDDPLHVMMRQIMALFDGIPVEGERQARPPRVEGERAPRLLERIAATDRLTHRRGREARRQDQEEARN
jgi:site-specific DNA recombinase